MYHDYGKGMVGFMIPEWKWWLYNVFRMEIVGNYDVSGMRMIGFMIPEWEWLDL